MRILLIEDDIDIATRIGNTLKKAAYAIDICHNGIDGEFMGAEQLHDLIVLDLGLPGRPGLEVLQNWRKQNIRIPVLILTARDAWHERVDGLKAGADDYLGKPFHLEELLARIDALLRRSKGVVNPTLTVAGIQLDPDTQSAITDGNFTHRLTAIEFRLLRYFMTHPGKILSKQHLTEHIYEEAADHDSNVIEVYVNRLRKKLGKDLFQTRRGQGYVFVAPQE